jgi:hypothetical protein
MERSNETNERNDSGEAGELNAEEYVKKLFSSAFCATYTCPEPIRYYIVGCMNRIGLYQCMRLKKQHGKAQEIL